MTASQTNWPLVFALLVAGLFAAAQFGKLTLTLEVAKTVYWFYAALVPFLVSIVGLVGVVFGAVAGRTISRIGFKRALVWAMVGGGSLSLIQATLPPIWLFAVLRFGEGISHLAIVVAAPTLMASLTTEATRPIVMGLWGMFFGISFALTALVLPLLLSFGGYRLVFASHGAGMLFVGLVLAWKIPRLPGFGEAASDTSYWAEHRAIYGSPHLALPGLVFLWYAVCFIALLAVLPTLFRLPLWVVTLMPLISLVGTFGAGVACRYASPSHVALVGFSVSLILSAGIFVHPDPVITSLALMLALGLVPGACFAAIPHYNTTPEARARATGGLAQCGNIGTTFGTPLFALAATYGERVGVAALTALFCAIGIAATLRLRRGIK